MVTAWHQIRIAFIASQAPNNHYAEVCAEFSADPAPKLGMVIIINIIIIITNSVLSDATKTIDQINIDTALGVLANIQSGGMEQQPDGPSCEHYFGHSWEERYHLRCCCRHRSCIISATFRVVSGSAPPPLLLR